MGIENLLNFIKPALLERSIVDFRGKTAAIDAMSWLYRGCYSCAVDLNQNIETHDFLYFIQKMVLLNLTLAYYAQGIQCQALYGVRWQEVAS